MKKCAFCAEDIQDAAIKCKHCGEMIDLLVQPQQQEAVPWYFSANFIVAVFCCVGPLALPLIWGHPRASLKWKIVFTIVALLLSWVIFKLMQKSVYNIKEYYQLLNELQ